LTVALKVASSASSMMDAPKAVMVVEAGSDSVARSASTPRVARVMSEVRATVPVALGSVTVTSAVEAAPCSSTRLDPLSVSSAKAKLAAPEAEAVVNAVASVVKSAS
jgi:hypothetical protein